MENAEIHESIQRSRSKQDIDHEIEEWLILSDFPDETRVNLTPRGRRFIFQKQVVLKSLEPVVSRAQWSRYRSNPKMSIPLSTIRLLISNKHELFMTSFTVTTIGNKKIQLPIKLPIRTSNNSLAKLLALLSLSKNVFLTGTYQTDQKEKIESLIETFDAIFDVNLCPGGEITQNQRGYYVKIPVPICTALVKAFTGEYQASVPQIIRSVAKCKDEQDIVDFVTTWLQFSRIYRFDREKENLFMFRYNDETRELIELIEKIGVDYEIGSIDSGNSTLPIPVYQIPNKEDNEAILSTRNIVSRLNAKIQNREVLINELNTIIDDLGERLEGVAPNSGEYRVWSQAVDERDRENLTEKLEEFERILQQTRLESVELKRILRERDSIASTEPIAVNKTPDRNVIDGLDRLRKEVDRLKEQLADISHTHSPSKELSYRVTQEFTMKSEQPPFLKFDSDLRKLVKIFLAYPDNWILFILGSKQALTKEQIRDILGKNKPEERIDLHKRLNDFVSQNILKVEISPEGEELYSIDRLQRSDLIGGYITTLLGNKELVPLEIRQLVRRVLR
ncbi:MAG: hypothetical protein ACXAC8_00400 [Candidatus Hodarchaeales archaeon]|jgi:hypothetical protein